MKKCSKCKIEKNDEEFHRAKNGRQRMCKACRKVHDKLRYDANPQQAKERVKNWKITNSERVEQWGKAWRSTPKRREKQRAHDLKRHYNLTLENYELMKAKQNGKCAICKTAQKKLHVDHNHTTGKVRELLCNKCNGRVGAFESEVANAIQLYLIKHNS